MRWSRRLLPSNRVVRIAFAVLVWSIPVVFLLWLLTFLNTAAFK
jgi:hypothetical protein